MRIKEMKITKKNGEEVIISVINDNMRYSVFTNGIGGTWLFDCAKNERLLTTLLEAYKNLIKKGDD